MQRFQYSLPCGPFEPVNPHLPGKFKNIVIVDFLGLEFVLLHRSDTFGIPRKIPPIERETPRNKLIVKLS